MASIGVSPNPAAVGQSVKVTWSGKAGRVRMGWPCGSATRSLSGASGSFSVIVPCAGDTEFQLRSGSRIVARTTLHVPTTVVVPPPTGSWTLRFEDRFDYNVALGSFPSAVANRWQDYAYTGNPTYLGGYYYPQKVVSIHDGYMDLWLHAEDGKWLMAAPQPILDGSGTKDGKYQTYGRYELHWSADAIPGYYGVPLLWPLSGLYLQDGEVDWPEGNLTGSMSGFIHKTDSAPDHIEQYAVNTGIPFAPGPHITVTEWRPDSVKLFLDGSLRLTATERIPHTPMRWVLQHTVSPKGLPPVGTSGHVRISYVRVDKYTP